MSSDLRRLDGRMPSIARTRRLRTAADPPAHPAIARAKFDGRRPRNVTSSAWLSPRCADVPRLRTSRAATFRLDCSRSGKISGWRKALYDPAYPPLARCCFAARAEAILPPARKRERTFRAGGRIPNCSECSRWDRHKSAATAAQLWRHRFPYRAAALRPGRGRKALPRHWDLHIIDPLPSPPPFTSRLVHLHTN